jgi:coenzyme F420-reducing hydrogenase gamma subunit
MKINVKTMDKEYRQLSRKLAKTGWICHGYAQNRGPGAGGPCYQWSRKVRGKTVSVALSKEQFLWITKAIANWRNAQEILKSMEQLSLTMLFKTLPDATRRKPLSKKVMGTN